MPKRKRSSTLRKATFARDGGVCALCGITAEKWVTDHIIPFCEDGPDTLANARTLCLPCDKPITRGVMARAAERRRAAKAAARRKTKLLARKPRGPHMWWSIVHWDPDVARERILAQYRATPGGAAAVAPILGVSHRSLCTYVRLLGRAGDIEAIREAARAARGVTP